MWKFEFALGLIRTAEDTKPDFVSLQSSMVSMPEKRIYNIFKYLNGIISSLP